MGYPLRNVWSMAYKLSGKLQKCLLAGKGDDTKDSIFFRLAHIFLAQRLNVYLHVSDEGHFPQLVDSIQRKTTFNIDHRIISRGHSNSQLFGGDNFCNIINKCI